MQTVSARHSPGNQKHACVVQQHELSTLPTRVVGQQSPTNLQCLRRGPCAAALQRTPAATGGPLASRARCYPEAQAAAVARQAAAGDLRTVRASIRLVLHGCDRLLHALLCSGASSSRNTVCQLRCVSYKENLAGVVDAGATAFLLHVRHDFPAGTNTIRWCGITGLACAAACGHEATVTFRADLRSPGARVPLPAAALLGARYAAAYPTWQPG